MQDTPECIVDAKNTLGEGPIWDEAEQALYWLDITERIIHRFDPDVGSMKTWMAPSEVGAIALRHNRSGILAGLRTGFSFLNLESGAVELIDSPEVQLTQNRLNDGKCDPCGRFWCGSIHEVSDPALRKPIASVYRMDPDLQLHRIWTGVKTSNGFAWSPDGLIMYFTDTPTLQIVAFDYDLETGDPSNERVFVTVPPGQGRPDGATVDIEGCLWSAHFGGWRVTRYSPDGQVLRIVELPVANVTSCTFGGPQMDTLYITTAREDLTESQLSQQPLAGGLFALKPGVVGIASQRFAG